ncbi:LysR family transcriptional regulator [Microbacterium sp. M28]|uniref:LysR family transcriptional regulator n=1 Tax=Microbacterium sp. M28 TaxID=2962064 RepID=UPI0021F45950|nr:LysR family transcriptional regulator [Microbacterium sp. M28]UYO97454.1 LysR family transcriptional regulator [Microbacterium sp. M28]
MDVTLDITLLRTFVAIREHGGFGRAAAALQCSQPTVSQHVRVLERRLGLSLVEKVGRVARFTPDGERLLIEARRIISVHDEALRQLRGAPASADVSTEAEIEGVGVQDSGELSAFLRFVADCAPQLLSEWSAAGNTSSRTDTSRRV